jgi:hypothetical protein
MPPSVVVSFVKEAACDGLSKGEMMLLSEFEHAAHGFLSFRLASCGWRCPDGRFLGEGKEIRFQGHAAGMSARQETRFNLGPQVKNNGHGNVSSRCKSGQTRWPAGAMQALPTHTPGVFAIRPPVGVSMTQV